MGQFGGVFSPAASVRGLGSLIDFDMWRAQVCISCRLAFCEDCLDLGHPTPCPECGTPTKPAYRGFLNAMGEVRKLMETETFYGHTDAEAIKKAEERNIPKERIVMLRVMETVKPETSTGQGPTMAAAVKDAYVSRDAFDVSQPLVKEKGFWPFKKWRVEIMYKMPAEVTLRYRIR
jgi:hypothetical protein